MHQVLGDWNFLLSFGYWASAFILPCSPHLESAGTLWGAAEMASKGEVRSINARNLTDLKVICWKQTQNIFFSWFSSKISAVFHLDIASPDYEDPKIAPSSMPFCVIMLLAPHLALALMWNMSLNTDLFFSQASQCTAEGNNVQESHPTHCTNLDCRVSLG